ncbi:hypothetical protein [Spiroplasma endosymbiont of Nomada ruficornis]|uniref:hypothetical protein n=1 Tax=Spiroplasma endosymbiont of Nomada ruficornis TaxID=3066325 RepID=UPI00313F2C77
MIFNRNNCLSNVFESKKQQIKNEVEQCEDNYILNVNEEEYTNYLYDKFSLDEITLSFDTAESDVEEAIVNGQDFFGHHCQTKKPRIKFKIPVFGSYELLSYSPSSFIMVWGLFSNKNINLSSNCLSFEIISYQDDNIESVNHEYNQMEKVIKDNTGIINRDLKEFNVNLKPYISNVFKNRKEVLLKRQKDFTRLKIPLKQNKNMSETFSIPISKPGKRIEIPKIVTKSHISESTPIIDVRFYEEILKIINDCGKEFERLKNSYQQNQEEDFRNNILFVINSHFNGTATGETFNVSVKTDILLRYDNSNVFIAECKIWNGISHFKKAIDQLIGYLTWRDTKTALIIFVRKSNVKNVIETIKLQINEHKKFKKAKL